MRTIDTSKPVHLVINPRSGYGKNQYIVNALRSEAKSKGIDLVTYTTGAPEDATRYARRIADSAAAVVVWGGDGTVNEVAGGLAGTDVPILACPAGTENLLAKELRMPGSPDKIIETLVTGEIVSCDVGLINGKSFLMVIGVGFDGEVVERVAARRTGHISHLSYFWPIWRTFWEHQFPHIRVVADDTEVFDGRCLAFVGNISRYASGLRICRDAEFDDGLLDLVVFSCRRQIALLCHAARTVLKAHTNNRNVVYRRFRRLTVQSDQAVPCQVDGDVGPSTPLEISVMPARIRLIVSQRQFAKRFRRKGDKAT